MISLRGAVTAGLGRGAHFMSVPWVRDAVRRLLGFTPYPGTLNVSLNPDMIDRWERMRNGRAIPLAPPLGQTCGAVLVSVIVVPDVEAAVIVPDVTRHGKNLLELIAPVHIRSRLGLRDDDPVTLEVRS
jgi:riboflavin kinase, archaea type